MERNIQRNGVINLLALVIVAVAGFAVTRHSHTEAGQVTVAFLVLGVLVAAVSWFQMRLEINERLERLEYDELTRNRASSSALFEGKDAEAFPAGRAREQFEKFFVPGFTALLCLFEGGGAWLLFHWLKAQEGAEALRDPILALALFALFALTLFLLGKFSATLARIESHRLLRPSASFVLLAAYLCFFVALGIVGVQAGLPRADKYVGYVLCGLLALVATETLINLILEIYRPRVRGKVERPLYESRLVGLLGQPEGLITTAAQALDYQFGFKVSETWFYRFFEKALGWLLLAQFAVLVLSTCVVFIEAGEQGLLERFGNAVKGRTVLNPGAHLKLPWPIDRVFRFRTEQIQTFVIGSAPEPDRDEARVVLWTVAHTKEENFLVANRTTASVPETTPTGAKRTPPVSLITGSIPIQFQITNLIAWAYTNEDSGSLLRDLATREVVRYLVGADMNDIMSHGRGQASQILAERIQEAVDRRSLGARILMAGLQDLHPPGKVAPDYEKVIGELQKKQAKILAARADEIRTNALAVAQAVTLTNRATADRVSREVGAVSRAALFTNQIPAFEAAPAVYAQRAYLQAFVRATANARKYVILTTNTSEVLTFDLQEKIRADLGDITVTPKKTQ
jgi:regulator of protease activity HflC (stomatin/prohibitin superfamily)/drug/metabolite transporter superfamily protein YnfA